MPATTARPPVFPPSRHADRLHLSSILRNQLTGGLLMMLATIAALVWANLSPSSYQVISRTELAGMTVAHWVADGVLTIFFFVAGMELKREFVEGALSRPLDALVPIVAALSGMALPALLYLATNLVLPGGQLGGWAVPMATDIAFALSVLALVGRHLPTGLRAALLTLAVVDDLGAILVIAVFFTHGVSLAWLAAALALLALWWGLQKVGLTNGWLFIPVAIAAWWCTLQSGIHATIAGVALGLLVTTREHVLHDNLDRWMHRLEPWSAGLVVPLFALFAAGVPVDAHSLASLFQDPVPLGILLGLVVGKAVGIFSGAWLTARFTRACLPDGVRWGDMFGMAVVAGIGFTVSMLIAELAFPGHPELTDAAKMAVLVASAAAALLGGLILWSRGRLHARHTRSFPAQAQAGR